MWYQTMLHDPAFEISNVSRLKLWSGTTLSDDI